MHSREDLLAFLELHGLGGDEAQATLSHLLYFGFFGIQNNAESKYIWDFGYNMRLLSAAVEKSGTCLDLFEFQPLFGIEYCGAANSIIRACAM